MSPVPSARSGTDSSVMGRNVAVLRVLASGFRQSLKEIAADTGLAKPTAHRVLAGLVEAGMVIQDGAFGEYRLTSELLRIAGRIDDRVPLIDAVTPAARSLTLRSSWPVALGLLERGRMVVYFSTRGLTTQTFRPSTLYESLDLRSALGQAALLTLSPNQIARELDGLPEFSRGSEARKDIEQKLVVARERGYGVRLTGRGGTASVALGLRFGSPRVGAIVSTVFESVAKPALIRKLADDLTELHEAAARHYFALRRPMAI